MAPEGPTPPFMPLCSPPLECEQNPWLASNQDNMAQVTGHTSLIRSHKIVTSVLLADSVTSGFLSGSHAGGTHVPAHEGGSWPRGTKELSPAGCHLNLGVGLPQWGLQRSPQSQLTIGLQPARDAEGEGPAKPCVDS